MHVQQVHLLSSAGYATSQSDGMLAVSDPPETILMLPSNFQNDGGHGQWMSDTRLPYCRSHFTIRCPGGPHLPMEKLPAVHEQRRLRRHEGAHHGHPHREPGPHELQDDERREGE